MASFNAIALAFKIRNYYEAVRLLEKVDEQSQLSQQWSLSSYTINISSIDPWNKHDVEAGLLHLSSRNGWLDITRKLIEQYELDPRIGDSDGNTCLHYAAAGNQLEVMKCVFGRDMRIRYDRNYYGASPLHIAAANESLNVMKYLITHHHWNTEEIDSLGRTVLHYGVRHIDIVEYLITECSCDPMVTDKDGKTVLHYAVEKKCSAVVAYLMSINRVDKDRNTFLHLAAKTGSNDVVKQLIHYYKCNPEATNRFGQRVLHCAVEHISIVKYFITECICDPMVTDENGKTVLHYAVQKNCSDVVEYLVSVNPVDKDGNTFLHIAAKTGFNGFIKHLIGYYKCNPEATNRFGQRVLHCAVEHISIVKYLITECNCDPMVTDENGKTVLHYAVQKNCSDVVEYLVSVNPMDKDGNTFLHSAAKTGLYDVVKQLIGYYKCNPEATNRFGQTVLHYAVEHYSIVQYLITECNCDPMVTDKDGKTVLHYAVEQNRLDSVAEYLVLSGKCDPILAANKYGNTVLLFASANGILDIVKYLIHNHECDPMVIDEDGKTVLHYAVKQNHSDVVGYLVSTGKCDPILAANEYGNTVLLFASANGILDVVKDLIHNHECDPMVIDEDGKTVLHYAVENNHSNVVEYLLSTGKCDPVAKDNKGRTPLQLADGNNQQKVRSLFIKFGQVKTSYPVDSYVNVLILGNPGAGKSTLSHVITDTATGSIAFGSLRNVKGVKPCTAGIIPYKLQHKTLGNIILHDFAGHSEYYSSHSAVIENLLQGSGGVFLIVVNILEKGVIKQFYQWLTVVRNEEQKGLDQCHIIVVVSHLDEISDPVERRKEREKIQEIIGRKRCDCVFLDCRKLGGGGVDSFFNKLSSTCESIRSTSGRNLSLYCHMMYGLLVGWKKNIMTLSDIMFVVKYHIGYIIPDERETVIDLLQLLDSIGLIKVLNSEDKVWVVVNKGILLSELDGILFAPKTFKEHVDIASNTGIVSVSGLTRLFPDYDPDMLICFLKNMELCQEMNSSFLRMTNLHQLTVGESEEEEGEMERRGERLLFFPCLLYSGRPDEMTRQVYQFGWCLQCTGEHHFFPPRYFHILSLHLAYKLALPQDEILSRRCTFWKNGLYWFDGHGVGVLVEVVDESQCVLVLMSCEEGYNMVELRREVIGEVMSVYKESCPSLEVKELVIDPKELDYPVNTPRKRTVYSVKDVMSAIDEGRPFAVSDTSIKRREVKSILPDESLADISKLSLLGGCDIKV